MTLVNSSGSVLRLMSIPRLLAANNNIVTLECKKSKSKQGKQDKSSSKQGKSKGKTTMTGKPKATARVNGVGRMSLQRQPMLKKMEFQYVHMIRYRDVGYPSPK